MRIDAKVKTFSYWQRAYLLLVYGVFVIIAINADLSWLAYGSLFVVSLIVLVVFHSPTKKLLHLTSPHLNSQLSQNDKWQLLYHTPKQQALWEANLIGCTRYGQVVQMSFFVTHPMPKKITLALWQDQVDTQTWRRLSVLARW